MVPETSGGVREILIGVSKKPDIWTLGNLSTRIPHGDYRLVPDSSAGWSKADVSMAILGCALGAYRFESYRATSRKEGEIRLFLESRETMAALNREIQALTLVRDLVNTPAGDMMPENLALLAEEFARTAQAEFRSITGQALLREGFPAIHAVGRASVHAPQLLDLCWGKAEDPEVVLIGKGVCFDTGGLNIKGPAFMRFMKKDMGGAAHVLGLAHRIINESLPVRLRVLIPAVDNAISGNSYRPGDVLETRKGLYVEVDDTDAEGRLILADALTVACEQRPSMIIDFATLTGAARVALGTDVPAFFTNDEEIAEGLRKAAGDCHDPLWRLPLHEPYMDDLKSEVADIVNAPGHGYGGAIAAGLFLQRFIDKDIPWLHIDLMAWNRIARPGRPVGGEAMGMRAVFRYLQTRMSMQ